jgi:formylglycine-generating enzyme required for sulfatase activity
MKYLILVALLITLPVAAVNRGITVTLKDSEAAGAGDASVVQLYTKSYALVIGNDQYSGGWPRLSKAVSDARKVAAALETKGFDVTLKTNLDGRDLQDAFEDFFIDKGRDPESRLFVWYAGHGDTVNGEGYLIPVNGVLSRDKANFLRRSVSLREFGRFVRLAESKHIYTVFDSCFAGTIFNVARSAPPPAITRVTGQPVRQFLSSGDAGQTVSDDGTFATLFVDAMSGKRRSDLNGDGYITGSEMGAFLTDRVSNYTNNKQVPRQGKLNDPKYDTGDFVFLASLTTPPSVAQAISASLPGDSSFSLADLTSRANANKQVTQAWAAKLQDMNGAFQQVQTMDGDRGIGTDIKLSAWQRFNAAFAEDNPYSAEDNTLRKQAKRRIQALEKLARQPQQVASLGSTSGGALSSTGKACADCPEMVLIPAGSFRMGDLNGGGDDDEKPVHRVDVAAFGLGKFEVTFAQYDAFARATNRALPNDGGWGRGSRPVINVSWDDAQAYVKWLSSKTGTAFRLPTEAEWEYAARAGTTTKYSWGNEIGRNNAVCNGCGSQWDGKQTAPVGQFRANAFGLYDMHGNVWEWTEDCYNGSYQGAPSTGAAWTSGNCTYRVLRGGSWLWLYKAATLRAASRLSNIPAGWNSSGNGLRVAQDL